MPKYAEKNMRYAHFAKICGKCSKVPNMCIPHIRVFLTCLLRSRAYTTNNYDSMTDILSMEINEYDNTFLW